MTVSEMHTYFKFGMDKLDSLNYPNFEPEEIDILLNNGQDRFIKQRYGVNNNKRQSVEETQKRTDDLKEIVINAIITPSSPTTTNIHSSGQFVTLPSDYWFTIQESCHLNYLDCHGDSVTTTERIKVKVVQHDDFNNIIEDPFNKPWEKEIIRLMADGKVELVPGNNRSVTSYILRYIKKPNRINITTNTSCELSEHVHQEIVDEAIKIALEGIEAKRQQSFDKIINTNE